LTKSCGDFVIKRLPNEWTYQLAVVVDDGAQGITHIVRGNDLLDSSARQVALQEALSLQRPIYNHIPLLLNEAGHKLSKSEQAPALSTMDGVACLMHAWCFLGGRDFAPASVDDFWRTVLMPRV
jgi:glutamyl-Q tRNA(Asp) synthetase